MADANDILQTALDDFKLATSGWQPIYEKARDDLHFLSDEPNAQWIDDKLLKTRKNRPVYTIDQLGQFIHQVENDVRMNTPTINVIPDGSGADIETAEIFSGIIKGIEYKSNADAAYDTACSFAIRSSIGFIRVDSRYCNEEGFEQELFIDRVINPQAVYIDPDSIQPDGSDAMYGFVLEEISVKKFKELYPDAAVQSFGEENPNKTAKNEDKVVVADYYKIIETRETVGRGEDGKVVPYTNQERKREIIKRTVKRCKLSGADVLQESAFAGKYIPIIPVYGEENWIEGQRNLYSLIRKSKQSQMMYNLTKSLEIEVLMKQPQAPFMAAAGQVSGFEAEYQDPSKVQVLHYNQTDVKGNPAPMPQRMQPPMLPNGFAAMARESADDIKATMGLYNASIGLQGNETSGIAIQRRKQEGDIATFHFGDNLVRSITQVGRILVHAIPEIYDTARIVKIIGEEEEPQTVGVNGEREEDQERDFNLSEGKYDVKVITGASFTTQRQEAGEFYNQLIQSMPDLMPVIGDLVFKYQDTAGSQAIAARLKKLVDPKLLEDKEREELQQGEIDPEKEQMAQMLEQLQAQMAQMQAELQSKQGDMQLKVQDQQLKAQSEATKAQIESAKLQLEAKKLEIEQQKVEIDAYNAQKEPVNTPKPNGAQSIKLDTTGFQMMKTPEQEELERAQFEAQQQAEAQEIEMKMAQTNAVIQALNGIQQQVANLTETTMANAEQTANLAAKVSQPIEVIRDEQGNITGAR